LSKRVCKEFYYFIDLNSVGHRCPCSLERVNKKQTKIRLDKNFMFSSYHDYLMKIFVIKKETCVHRTRSLFESLRSYIALYINLCRTSGTSM